MHDLPAPPNSTLPVLARRGGREVEAFAPAIGHGPAASHGQRSVGLVIWQRKGLVLACVALALAGGIAYLWRATPLYKSSSTIYVQQSVPKIMSDDLGGSMTAVNLATQCQLITSTAILDEAMKLPSMADAPVFRRLENPVGFLKSIVKAEPSKEGDLILVSVTSPFPKDAALIVNGVVQAYIEYQNKQHQSSAVQVAKILQKELDSHEADLKEAQAKMLALRVENPQLVAAFNRRDAGGGKPSDLGTALSTAQFRANDLHAALRTAEAAQSDPARLRQVIQLYQLGNLLPPSMMPQLSSEYQADVARLNHLHDAHFGPANEQVLEAQADLDRVRGQMDQAVKQEATDAVETIRIAAAAADDQALQLRTAFESEQKSSLTLNAKEAEYDQLAASAERSTRALDALDARLKEIHFTEDVGPMSISVLETAKPEGGPVSPVRANVMGECLVAGLLLGLATALLADRMDQRLRSIEEIGALVESPVLGVIPRVVRRGVAGTVGREAFLAPRSATAEAFRTVRTAIYFGAGSIDERSVKTIMVTSPTPGDGKSTCVSNLAIAVAQAGRRVLLIDADCRRPVQHKVFGVAAGGGLTAVLTGKLTLAEAVIATEVDRLDLLQCGPLPHNPAELLDSQALLDLLAEAAGRYDQVLIDSPPINLVSDARILAASCDASVMVLRAERSTRRGATMAWNILASVGAHRLGVIVNDVTRRSDGYYGYGYQYYGRYGYGPKDPVVADEGQNGDARNGRHAGAAERKALAATGDQAGA